MAPQKMFRASQLGQSKVGVAVEWTGVDAWTASGSKLITARVMGTALNRIGIDLQR
jgi:hypothetical protein